MWFRFTRSAIARFMQFLPMPNSLGSVAIRQQFENMSRSRNSQNGLRTSLLTFMRPQEHGVDGELPCSLPA